MKAIFIDRDGTMGGEHMVVTPQDYSPFRRTKAAFELLNNNGFSPIMFSNQSCISRGLDGGYDFAAEFRDIGAYDWFICPHDSGDNCDCRKPEPGLLYKAKDKYQLDLTKAYVIGDRWSDMAAGGKAGCRLVLVLTGRGKEAIGADREKWADYSADYIAEDLYDAAEWLCANYK